MQKFWPPSFTICRPIPSRLRFLSTQEQLKLLETFKLCIAVVFHFSCAIKSAMNQHHAFIAKIKAERNVWNHKRANSFTEPLPAWMDPALLCPIYYLTTIGQVLINTCHTRYQSYRHPFVTKMMHPTNFATVTQTIWEGYYKIVKILALFVNTGTQDTIEQTLREL